MQVQCIALEGSTLGQPRGMGWGIQDGGTHVHTRVIPVDVWKKPPQYCEIIFFQLKKIKMKKNQG